MTKNKGDIAKARRILVNIDTALALTGDANVFDSIHPDAVKELSRNLNAARNATENILHDLGDLSNNDPAPTQERRDRYAWFERQK